MRLLLLGVFACFICIVVVIIVIYSCGYYFNFIHVAMWDFEARVRRFFWRGDCKILNFYDELLLV